MTDVTLPGTERTTVFKGRLIEVATMATPNGSLYEFVRRIGAVTVLPILQEELSSPMVLAIHNNRWPYGISFGLPSGYADGGFDEDTREHPHSTARRELQEETGYAPEHGEADIEVLKIPAGQGPFDFPRYLAIARHVIEVGGKLDQPHEQITLAPEPLEVYMERIFTMSGSSGLSPEANLAFLRAARHHGEDTVRSWVAGEHALADIVGSFSPWMTPVSLGAV